jgi:hypothetical protein
MPPHVQRVRSSHFDAIEVMTFVAGVLLIVAIAFMF